MKKRKDYLREGGARRSRKLSRISPRIRFLIVCEGSKTEPNYFRAFPIPPDSVVDVRGIGENTKSLVERALELRSAEGPYDQVWCVFDRDSFPVQNFNEALELARKNEIQVAYSNEAFELWYILHFFYLDTGVTREDYCHRLSKQDCLRHKYEKNSEIIYDELYTLRIPMKSTRESDPCRPVRSEATLVE